MSGSMFQRLYDTDTYHHFWYENNPIPSSDKEKVDKASEAVDSLIVCINFSKEFYE